MVTTDSPCSDNTWVVPWPPSSPTTACTWGVGATATTSVRAGERLLELRVSQVVRTMRVLCLPVADAPGPDSDRADIERNAIGLLSNFARPALDRPSDTWLGLRSPSVEISESGLWNINHMRGLPAPEFADRFDAMVDAAARS